MVVTIYGASVTTVYCYNTNHIWKVSVICVIYVFLMAKPPQQLYMESSVIEVEVFHYKCTYVALYSIG